MTIDIADFNAKVIDEFRANGRRVGGVFEGMPILLVHHIGAKYGAEHINPVAYLHDGERYAIFASKGGAPTNPAWYQISRSTPTPRSTSAIRPLAVRVSEATGEERDRLYRDQAERRPQFAVELAGELSGAPGAGGEPIHEWLEVRLFMVEPSTVTEAPVR